PSPSHANLSSPSRLAPLLLPEPDALSPWPSSHSPMATSPEHSSRKQVPPTAAPPSTASPTSKASVPVQAASLSRAIISCPAAFSTSVRSPRAKQLPAPSGSLTPAPILSRSVASPVSGPSSPTLPAVLPLPPAPPVLLTSPIHP